MSYILIEPLNFFLLAWTAFVIGAASPGPSTLLIASTSMAQGRRYGLAVAAGIMTGSLVWGILAASGFVILLTTVGWVAEVLRYLAGAYLLYLAWRSGTKAIRSSNHVGVPESSETQLAPHYYRGVLMHITNPKAVFAWLATVTVGTSPDAPTWHSFMIVISCCVLGIIIFGGYAVLFATDRAQRIYRSTARWIDGFSAVIFGTLGLGLLLRRT